MRLGGPYIFGQPGVPVALRTGQQFYVPPGNYLITLGQVSILQYFDPSNNLWRGVAQPDNMYSLYGSDGFNYRIVNASGVVSGCSITNAGSGGTNGIGPVQTGVTVGFGAAPSNGQAAAAYAIVGGQISSTINIVQAGSGFVVPPMVLIDPPPQGGIQATAVAQISTAGAINAITVTNQGAGYISTPNVYVLPQYLTMPGVGLPVNNPAPTTIQPPGLVAPVLGINSIPPFLATPAYPVATGTTGALLTSAGLTGSGTLTGLVMTQYGGGYAGTTIPTIAFSGGGLAGGVAATALMSMSLISVTITAGGAAYSVAPIWSTNFGLLKTTDGCNGVFQPRMARGTAALTGGVISSTVIEDVGFGFQAVPQIGVTQTGGTPATTVATLTPVVGGVNDVSLLQQAQQ